MEARLPGRNPPFPQIAETKPKARNEERVFLVTGFRFFLPVGLFRPLRPTSLRLYVRFVSADRLGDDLA